MPNATATSLASHTKIILGIDPGSLRTGYGLIECNRHKITSIAYGVIQSKGEQVSEKLHTIYTQLCEIIHSYHPTQAAIEEVFMQLNVQSALKLGQARGAALSAIGKYNLPLEEYSARVIKKTLTGYGAASKEQVQWMVQQQLDLRTAPPPDAADALAIAICDSCYQHRSLV